MNIMGFLMNKKLGEIEPFSKKRLDPLEILIIYGPGIFIILLAWFYFEFLGYPLVTTAKETLTSVAPAIYMLPAFFPFGILIGEEIWYFFQFKDFNRVIIKSGGLLILAFMSGVRLIFQIPISGHSLILSYFILQEVITNQAKYIFRLMIGIIVLCITLYYKIMLWKDPITLFLGLIGGVLIWGIIKFLNNRINTKINL
ncbi:MAG: hypothetical protein EAX86_06295 [Candidatus Heimdallarchaeota archaeon]|nr:hypothetical protein [Candidatus Heimdallarchaeota archaeon]